MAIYEEFCLSQFIFFKKDLQCFGYSCNNYFKQSHKIMNKHKGKMKINYDNINILNTENNS